MAALESYLARIERANMHIRALDEAVNAFVNSDAYRIEAEFDYTCGEIDLYARAMREPPSLQLGIIIGDVVNNLRAALDNLVWGLTERFSGPAPPHPLPRTGPDTKWRHVRVPIALTPTQWTGNIGSNLWGVDPGLHTQIEGLQPFKRRQADPSRDEFAILEELWNIDKHRHPHLGAFFVGLKGVASGPPVPGLPWPPEGVKHEFEVLEQRPIGPFEGRAKLGRVREAGRVGEGYMRTSNPEMSVNANLTFDVAFEQGPPAYGGPVIETLERLRTSVAAALIGFESEFR